MPHRIAPLHSSARLLGLLVACAIVVGTSPVSKFGLGFLNPQSEIRGSAVVDWLRPRACRGELGEVNPKSSPSSGATLRASQKELATPGRPPLNVPDGFVVERVADDLGIRFPMFGAFANDGRLFVAESSGLDLHAELKAGARNCRIRVLDDIDGDGRFDAGSVFADKLVCPMGLAWRDGKLYVADPPDVVVFTDNDADDRADDRKVILSGFGHQTNGSLHGLVFGPDGMLYMTMGSPDGYSLKRPDGTVLEGNSGALIRCRPDGSEPEVLCRGFVNLIEVAFTARGDIIGTDNWYQEPSGGLRDALVHLVDGGLYPYLPDNGTRYPITGAPLPPITLYPAVAVSGLVCYQGSAYPEAMRGDFFSAQFNARKIVHHKLVRHGATFRTVDEGFVTTEDPDFHPSDVIESADGSLIVIDTGSWYVEHCPTGQIRDVNAPGGIYRVRNRDATPLDDPWGRNVHMGDISPEQLAELLDDRRPQVRDRSSRALAANGAASVPVLASILNGRNPTQAKQRAIWSLATNPDDGALAPLRKALESGEPDVVVPAAKAVALRGDTASSADLQHLLTDRAPSVRLAAAEALAHVGSPSSIPALWQALSAETDPFLQHALVHAAHRLADAAALQQALTNPNPKVQKAALLLLDQPPRPPNALGHEAVVERFNVTNSELRRTAREILVRHPEWARYCVGSLRQLLATPRISTTEKSDLVDLLLAFQVDGQVQELVADAIRNEGGEFSTRRRVLLLDVVSQATLADIPRVWIDALAEAMEQSPPDVRLAAVRCAAILQISELDERFDTLANSSDEPFELRREALRAIAPRRMTLRPESFHLLLDDLDGEADPLLRLASAEVFGKSRLDGEQLIALLAEIQGDALISPSVLLPMLQRSTTPETTSVVLDYLAHSVRGGWRPPPNALAGLLKELEGPPRARLESLLQTAQENSKDVHARMAEFLPLLEGGDTQRGLAAFFSRKAACSTCHRIGSEGGQIGPDLTKIGAIRAGRDIVESIVFPSSTIAQEFDQYMVFTTEGRTISGIMARQTADTVVMRDSSGGETRLRRDQIEEIIRQPTSIMPEALERLFSQQELRDLLAFLQSLK